MALSLKRVLLGRALTSSKLEHQLLPKVLALPVFASDQLSSVAYATEQMMLILVLAGAGALSLMLPLGLGIAVLLAVVITSYRQTCRAYPQGGGSYIVARENLGTLPGLIAAAAIQTSYVLTVAVSVTAGTIAITSALPGLAGAKVPIAIGFIWLITVANLRGVKEAGRLFAVPTYGFVAMVFFTLATGLYRCLSDCPQADTADLPLHPEQHLTAFLVLTAFSSGATALTGVEAIADGVQAFRRPQSRNAAGTLSIMGALSIPMFLGITVLTGLLDVRVTEEIAQTRSVLAQVGETTFGGGWRFAVLQLFTAGILVLAANTAYQDFPRLSAILARDRFMPSQFRNRGDRLVFSNGIVFLAILASLLVWVFQGELSKLIHLYVVGVFTALTLSQAGMVRRWMRLKGVGWRRGIAINGLGGVVTGIVLVIVAVTQFLLGAWIVIAAVPVIVLFFLWVHRHYEAVARQLRRGLVAAGETRPNHVVMLVPDVDAATAEALGYVRSIRPDRFTAVHVKGADRDSSLVLVRWREMAPSAPELEVIERGRRSLLDAIRGHLRSTERELGADVTVVVPELIRRRTLLGHLVDRWDLFRLKAGLLRETGIVVADVPVHQPEGARLVEVDGRPLIPTRTVVLCFVSGIHDATVRAVNYAAGLDAAEVRAVYFALDPEESGRFAEQWADSRLAIGLDVVEAPFRDLTPSLLEEVRRETARRDTVVSVVMPELIVKRWWHFFLHNQSGLFIKRQLLFEPRCILSSVPFPIE
jgi:amino acid transporter